MDDIEQIHEELLRLQSGKEPQLEQAISTSAQLRNHRDRSFVVQKIIWLYLLSMAASIGYLLVRGLSCKEDEYTTISEIVKIAILPVVTLVIGYYFASSRSE
jgi:hypothetical protein